MKMILSIPRTISNTVRVTSATQPSTLVIHSTETSSQGSP
jgi:hypothetical protein